MMGQAIGASLTGAGHEVAPLDRLEALGSCWAMVGDNHGGGQGHRHLMDFRHPPCLDPRILSVSATWADGKLSNKPSRRFGRTAAFRALIF